MQEKCPTLRPLPALPPTDLQLPNATHSYHCTHLQCIAKHFFLAIHQTDSDAVSEGEFNNMHCNSMKNRCQDNLTPGQFDIADNLTPPMLADNLTPGQFDTGQFDTAHVGGQFDTRTI